MARLEISGLDKLVDNMGQFAGQVEASAEAIADYYAPQMEAFAKDNAPWQDRTGNARQNLTGVSVRQGRNYVIVLGHKMDYGPQLELKYQGRYAIIMPTMQYFYGKMRRELRLR